MDTSILDRLIKSVNVERNLLPFLQYLGWEQVEPNNANWIVMHGERDIQDRPLELVFPSDSGIPERHPYILKAIELLTALRNEPMQLVVQSIIKYDRDLLYVRNTETRETDAIALNLAVDQISNLKRTIEYSASSEKEIRPYFNSPSKAAKRIARDFLFGHTFAGSFGFTVEAPRLPDPPKFEQLQLPLDNDVSPPPVNIPVERRVMERIARGLLSTTVAEQSRNPGILLDEYASGFNSNMCSAIVGMSKDKRATVEFRIAWSPKIKPGDDVAQLEPVKLRTDGYGMLEQAAEVLRTRNPEFVKVVGHVRGLTASDNPARLGTRRAVVIRGLYPGSSRAVDIVVDLERDDYEEAIKAHREWQSVQVSGVISRSGTGFRLLGPRDFKTILY